MEPEIHTIEFPKFPMGKRPEIHSDFYPYDSKDDKERRKVAWWYAMARYDAGMEWSDAVALALVKVK